MAKKLLNAALSTSLMGLLLGPICGHADPSQGTWLPQLFPSDNPWHTDISDAPVDWRSDDFIQFHNQYYTRRLQPDFGGNVREDPDRNYGFPYIVVDGWQPKVAVEFDYPSVSDGVDHSTGRSYPFYPIPDDVIWNAHWMQGGVPGYVWERNEDRHILIVDRDNNYLYELFNMWFDLDRWQWVGGSGAFWDMNTNDRRPEGWPSADESGLPILPGMLRYDEVYGSDEITHPLRVSLERTNGYVFPASSANDWTSGALPLGARLRLKADFDISGYPAEIQKIFRAMKRHGLLVATMCDGDVVVSGHYDTRWNNDVLNPAFNSLTLWNFEVVQLGWAP